MDEKGESIVVLGGTGFIGQAVVRQLVSKQQQQNKQTANRTVRVLTRNGSDENLSKIKNELGADALVGDLLSDSSTGSSSDWKVVLRKADYVVYSAQPDFDPEDTSGSGHLEKRLKMLKAVLSNIDKKGIKRFLLASGSSYLGSSSTDLDESDAGKGTPMGIGPFLAQEIELLKEELDSERYVVGLVGAVYGQLSWFTQMYLSSLQSEGGPQPVLMHDPAPKWPYIHVEDVARALEFLLYIPTSSLRDTSSKSNNIDPLVILSQEILKMDEFVRLIATQLGVSSTMSFMHVSRDQMKEMMMPPILVDYLSSDLPHSNAKLRRLGFEFKYKSTRDGIEALLKGQGSSHPTSKL